MRVNLPLPVSDDEAVPAGGLRLYLVRHGLTAWNVAGRLQGHTDIPLNDEGVRQAERVAARLESIAAGSVWSSDLSRAQATAETIAARHGLSVKTTPLLRESGLGLWEGLTAAEIISRGDEQLYRDYRRDSVAHRPPDGEPYQHVWDRLIEARDAITAAHREGDVIIVGHGGSLRVLLIDALGATISSVRRLTLDNASLSVIEINGERVRVRLMNDTAHLATER